MLCHRGLLALVSDRIPVPRLDQTTLDLPVIAFTLITALVTGVVFGVVPAFVSTNRGSDALRDGGRHGGGHRLHRVLNILVVGEVALSLVLLTGAGLLMRSLITLRNADLGFKAEGVLTARMQLPGTRYDARKADVAFRDSLARLAALPGVEAAAGGQCLPLPGSCIGTSFWRADRPRPANDRMPSCQLRSITPAYFKTLAIRQMAGRDFSASDAAEAAPAAIVSESVVRSTSRTRIRSAGKSSSASITSAARATSPGRSSASSATSSRRWMGHFVRRSTCRSPSAPPAA